MRQMWSPWRSQYIQTFSDEQTENDSSCFLCAAQNASENDVENLVVARREHCFMIMNRYPYNSGHLLVAPQRHVGELRLLDEAERSNLMQAITEATIILQNAFHCHGLNIGANLGRAAGAGLPDHVHFHLVPRWNGDTNFMPLFSDTKVISESMDETYRKLRAGFAQESPTDL